MSLSGSEQVCVVVFYKINGMLIKLIKLIYRDYN